MSELSRLVRWMRRAAPRRGALARALLSAVVGSAASLGLVVAAVALLVASSARPGLRAVAPTLVAIEVFAFVRSPLRYGERLSAHRLGLDAVTRWRRWLIEAVGAWPYARWRDAASGDLLERSLADTEALQDLWVRGVVPGAAALVAALAGDAVLAALRARGSFTPDALALAAIQLAGAAIVVARVAPRARADAARRAARGAYQAALVELSAAAPALLLLGAEAPLRARTAAPLGALASAEAAARRAARPSLCVAPLGALAALGVVAALRPPTSPTWAVAAVAIALATYEALAVVAGAADALVAVTGAADRLEALAATGRAGERPAPALPLRARGLRVAEGERTLVGGLDLEVGAGARVAIVGPSGSGKSALLRTLGGLDDPAAGVVELGGVALARIDEAGLRARVAMVVAEPGLAGGLAGDSLALGRALARDPVADLARLGLRVTERDRLDDLSRGERQRVALVQALAPGPTVVLLDEPTSGLGPAETDAALALLADSGAAVVVATHDSRVVAWCDVVVDLG